MGNVNPRQNLLHTDKITKSNTFGVLFLKMISLTGYMQSTIETSDPARKLQHGVYERRSSSSSSSSQTHHSMNIKFPASIVLPQNKVLALASSTYMTVLFKTVQCQHIRPTW